jgi:hypothetical protein
VVALAVVIEPAGLFTAGMGGLGSKGAWFPNEFVVGPPSAMMVTTDMDVL